MKKLFLLSMMCIYALLIQAQRCALLDFQVGSNITEEEVDGFSYTFRSNFNPTNYTVVERMMVNQVIGSFGYTRTDLTRQQMLRVGRELEAAVIVVGTMNKFMDEYSVDVQVINVSSGTTIATEGAAFQKTDYRTTLITIAQNLITKLGSGSLISNTKKKQIPEGFTDLGLPSGTVWKNFNAMGRYTYDEAVSQFGNRLPSKAQWLELQAECQWKWTGSGYKVTGPNGNSIDLPADGWTSPNGTPAAYYLSSTPDGPYHVWVFRITSSSAGTYLDERFNFLVRLIHD